MLPKEFLLRYEVFQDEGWVPADFSQIEPEDIFRAFHPDGRRYSEGTLIAWKARTGASLQVYAPHSATTFPMSSPRTH